MNKPDWEGFGRAVVGDGSVWDIDSEEIFELSLRYGIIKEVDGGYNPENHFDEYGICPEEGDPWYEYNFRG